MPDAHSKYSASGFEAAMLCPGKVVLEKGLPDSSSIHADTGTAAHSVLEMCLTGGRPAAAFKGRRIAVGLRTIEVDDEMVEAVQTAVDNIRQIVGDGVLLAEQRVNYSSYLGVSKDEAWGTSDVIAARDTELQVHDYKHGKGVEVDADDNPQMKLYALGALAQCQGILGEFETVRLVIHQPRIKSAPSEWVISVADLETWGCSTARSAVNTRRNAENADHGPFREWEEVYLRPGEKQCKFCRAKATCPALRAEVVSTMAGVQLNPASPEEFEEELSGSSTKLTADADDKAAWLSAALSKVDLIEDWCKAVRAEVERRLLAGDTVPGFKLVEGRRGNRAWTNAAEAEAALKAMRLKVEEMFELKLISPTTAEKLAKPAKKDTDPAPLIGPRQWPKLQALISRADGKPHVAPVTDPRPALVLTPAVDDFANVSTEPSTEEFA